LAKFFIHRPIFAIVIAVMIVIIGTIAGFSLPIAQYPQISPPTVAVSANYTGASAAVVNETVAQVIEEQINGTQGMDYMSSTSDDTGRYSLSVTFDVGTDGDMDAVKVQNNAAGANASLPSSVQAAGVTTRKSSGQMAYFVSLYSEDGTYDRAFMKNYATLYFLDAIKRVNGVGEVQVFGADYAMRVWMNPDRLAELGLTVSDITRAINEQNVQAPAGTVGGMPTVNGQEKQFTGKVQGRLTTPEEFGNVIIASGKDGTFVRLKDVARIETGERSNNIVAKFNGYPAVGFGIQLTSDANAMTTLAEVRKILEDAEKTFPPGLKMKSVFDSTDYINASITEVVHTFLEALLLVVLVIFIFLQSWRATLIPLLAVPVSLIGTFGAFVLLDFSINTLTLFAMVLAIGLVVDDAIVVIENVEHHMESGLSPVDATERAMNEVQGPVVAIAFVLAAVFVPVAFLGGMMGVLYKQFALTIAISMALSAFIALTLTPALCAMMLKPKKENEKNGILGRFFDKFNNWFDRTRKGYVGIVSKFIRKARVAFIFLLIVCGLTAIIYRNLPTTFVPEEDQGYLMVAIQLPPGTSTNQTQKTVDRIQQAAQREIKGQSAVMSINGFDIITLNVPNQGEDFLPNFRLGDMVYLYSYSPSEEPDVRKALLFKGNLIEIHTDSVTIKTVNPIPKAGNVWAIEHSGSDIAATSAIRSLHQFVSSAPSCRQLLLAQRAPELDAAVQLTRSYHPTYDPLLLKAFQAKDYFLLVGPPGTGKTSMALQFMVREALAKRQSILLMSYTNRAVDEICGMLSDNAIDYIRIGNPYSCDKRYRSHLLTEYIEQHPNLNHIRLQLQSSQVIVGTTSTLQSKTYLFELKSFSMAIIDEASGEAQAVRVRQDSRQKPRSAGNGLGRRLLGPAARACDRPLADLPQFLGATALGVVGYRVIDGGGHR